MLYKHLHIKLAFIKYRIIDNFTLYWMKSRKKIKSMQSENYKNKNGSHSISFFTRQFTPMNDKVANMSIGGYTSFFFKFDPFFIKIGAQGIF